MRQSVVLGGLCAMAGLAGTGSADSVSQTRLSSDGQMMMEPAEQVAVEGGVQPDLGFEEMQATPVPAPMALWGGLVLLGSLSAVAMYRRMVHAELPPRDAA